MPVVLLVISINLVKLTTQWVLGIHKVRLFLRIVEVEKVVVG